MGHYFTNNPGLPEEEREFEVRIRGLSVRLRSDAGVFSKRGLDFGTRLLIEAVELPEFAKAVDLGCGYGPVAAVLGRVYSMSKWTLVDVNERAVALARRNTESFQNRRRVVVSDGFSEVPDIAANAVILNPPIRAGKIVVYRLFQEAYDHLVDGGALWIVIQKKQGAASARKELQRLFPVVDAVARSGGYHVFRALRK